MSDSSGSSGEGGRPAAGSGAVRTAAGTVGAAPVALDFPGTAAGLVRYRASARRWCAAGAAAVLAAVLLAVFADGVGRLVWPLATLGVTFLLMSAAIPLQARRMRRVLAAGPWTAHTSVLVPRGRNGATVVLNGPGPGELLPLTPWTTWSRMDLLNRFDGVLWWCGDPRTGGVLAPPGGTDHIWAKPIRGRRARALMAGPRVRNLLTRPALSPPQPQPQSQPPSLSQTDPNDAGLLAGQVLPADTDPAVQAGRRRRPWWRGTFRWLLLAGCLMTALATSWAVASDDDPQVDLTVIGQRADGRCDVRWTDPFDGQPRTGPFHCHGHTGLLKGWETGFVVSYPPFKGDLYDAEWRGTSAGTVTDGVGLGGLSLAAVGLGGGTIRVVRIRWRRYQEHSQPGIYVRRRTPATIATAPADTAGATTLATAADPSPEHAPPASWAAFAAEAERQALLRGAAPAKPATEAPAPAPARPPLTWWRVPSLRALSGAGTALGLLAVPSAVLALTLVTDLDTGFGLDVLAVAMGTVGLLAAWRAVTSGIPEARLLAGAATAPGPRVRRYALLHDGRADGPTLVCFPVGAGALPEGLLPLRAPGPLKDPWAGLPAPTGTVELRGRFDDGRSPAVAWIDGHAYWPQSTWEDIGPDEHRELGTRFDVASGAE
ncbi:hypothetical protein [Streptomyces sp. NBC_01104]|uniref:hypothetical protein n=1 Tax=Streptomyces sp. NBC_01104 TaxID=2903750 RepID=UPI00386BDC9E|nr:hypothetical protein OG450_18665 [Streptomyces sp. NBC_01104]